MALDRHFSVAVFIVRDGKVLLHRHKKLGFWLPLGGHLEPNELPEDAARREAREEGGVEITIINGETIDLKGDGRVRVLVRPAHVLLEKLADDHEHMDLVYYATIGSDVVLKPNPGESEELRWFSFEELGHLEAPANVAYLGKKAIEALWK